MGRSGGKEKKMEEDPKTQKPTIRDAVTYIVDEQGNEIKAEVKAEVEKEKP